MKKLGLCLFMLFLAMQTTVLFAQSAERPTPWFTLSIEAQGQEAWMPRGARWLQVKYTNVSDLIQKDNCANIAWVYNMVVLRDGAPVEKKKRKTVEDDADETPNSRRIQVHHTERDACGGATGGIPSGATVRFPLEVSFYYDMTPGTYTITVNRETYPFEPAKSVTVWSNTVAIIVPPAENKPIPQK